MERIRKNINPRSSVFWLIDKVKKQGVWENIMDIQHALQEASLQEISIQTEERLLSLFKHAINTTSYFKSFASSSFENLPLINKSIIRNNYELFLSSDHANASNLTSVSTSGSTGTPFTMLQCRAKRMRHVADNIYFNYLAGTNVGEKLYYFRVWDRLVRKNKVDAFLKNIEAIDSDRLDPLSLERNFFSLLNRDKSRKAFLAYASTYEAIIETLNTQKSKGHGYNISAIISMSETLPDDAKNALESFFQAPVVSRYSNMENGFIAQQQPQGDGRYLLNQASFKVEIFKMEQDIPAEIGEIGRIVVTDLYNYAMPLLRYDTGDVGCMELLDYNGNLRYFLSKVEGRKVDFLYAVDGKLISPHTITNTMWRYKEVKQFQLIQHSKKKYELLLNVEGGSYQRSEAIVIEMKHFLGEEAEFIVKCVDEIPLLASGKRKKVINLINQR